MTSFRATAAAIALTMAAMTALPALAQDNSGGTDATTAPAPAASSPAGSADVAAPADAKRNPEQNWLKVCDTLDDGQKACILRQVVLNKGQFFGSFLLRDDPGQKSRLLAVAAVPLGVMLPFKMRWQIDNNRPIELPYILCDPISCSTQLVVNEAYVNSLKKGAKLKLIAKTRKGTDLTVEINLAGFTAVYDGDKYVSFDQFRQQSTGSNALEQMLQDRAEQIRQQKSGTDSTTTPPADQSSGN